MDRELRRLHLNVQSAKTKIYDEKSGEISKFLVDDRVDELTKFIEDIHKTYGEESIPQSERKSKLEYLGKV